MCLICSLYPQSRDLLPFMKDLSKILFFLLFKPILFGRRSFASSHAADKHELGHDARRFLPGHGYWFVTSTCGATSWIHFDGNGVCTMIEVKVGKKYWMLGTEKKPMDTVDFYRHFDISGANCHLFDWEGWLLQPGDIL